MNKSIIISSCAIIISICAIIISIAATRIERKAKTLIDSADSTKHVQFAQPSFSNISGVKDEEVVFGEIRADDIGAMGLAFRDAMIGGQGKYKWVEARSKKGDPEMMQIICHTQPKP